MQGAILNVKINLKFIKDEQLVSTVRKELKSIVPPAVKHKEEVMEKVNAKL